MKANLPKNIVKIPYKCDNLRIKIVETMGELRSAEWVRIKVFQQEQKININMDFDGRDAGVKNILACINEIPVGTTRVRRFYNKPAKIERMAVLREFRQRGIGKQILKYAIEFLRDERMKIAILTSREATKKFYSQSGFAESATIIDERGIRHILMMKIL